jgi:hypothetical protein
MEKPKFYCRVIYPYVSEEWKPVVCYVEGRVVVVSDIDDGFLCLIDLQQSTVEFKSVH